MILAVCLNMAVAGIYAGTDREIRKDYPVTKLADHIYTIYAPVSDPNKDNQGFRTNATFVVTSKGVVVFDPCASVYVGRMILKKIKTVTDKPVVAVFNTHVHGDHWLGNQAFKDANPNINIYGHGNMIKQAKEGEGDRWIKLFNDATDNAVVGTRPVPPNKPVKDGQVIKIGDMSFRIHHPGLAHTDGDIMVEVIQEKALLTGDIVRVGQVGISEKSFKGSIKAMDQALNTGSKLFIPGHGKAGNRQIVKNYRKFMSILRNTVAKHYSAGLSDFEIKPRAVKNLSEYKDWNLFKENIGRLVSLVYLEVEAESFQ